MPYSYMDSFRQKEYDELMENLGKKTETSISASLMKLCPHMFKEELISIEFLTPSRTVNPEPSTLSPKPESLNLNP